MTAKFRPAPLAPETDSASAAALAARVAPPSPVAAPLPVTPVAVPSAFQVRSPGGRPADLVRLAKAGPAARPLKTMPRAHIGPRSGHK